MAERRKIGKAKKCKVVIPQKGTTYGNFCGMPLDSNGRCPEHGSKTS